MAFIKKNAAGILMAAVLAVLSTIISRLIPNNFIGAGVFALIIGMFLNPVITKFTFFDKGFSFTSKKILRLSIVLMGASLSFSQVLKVGRYSLIVMIFTLFTAFAGGYLLGRLFKMDWKLAGLISAGAGICGGSAIAAVAPVIDAEESDVAYSISAIFIFDIIMVVIFPLMGRFFGMTDLGYGLWTGTAVNDTSAVVAAGYAFSDAAGSFSVIVKLTRTLAIIPVVLMFSYVNERLARKARRIHPENDSQPAASSKKKVDLKKIFPWFILMFLGVVAIKSTGIIPSSVSSAVTDTSKFLMVMSLGAIGLKTNFGKLAKSGIVPLIHGFLLSALIVAVSFVVQLALGQV